MRNFHDFERKSVALYFKSKYAIINMDIVNLEKIDKKLKKLPLPIKEKLFFWVVSVRTKGIRIVRMTKSYHDEPLKGKRKGQRSIRLSKSWRAIYREEKNGTINLIIVEEVSKHDY